VSASWLLNVKRICGKTRPVTATGVHVLRDEYARSIEPARAVGAETLKLERTIRVAAAEPSGGTFRLTSRLPIGSLGADE
jgi:hypothetical protein